VCAVTAILHWPRIGSQFKVSNFTELLLQTKRQWQTNVDVNVDIYSRNFQYSTSEIEHRRFLSSSCSTVPRMQPCLSLKLSSTSVVRRQQTLANWADKNTAATNNIHVYSDDAFKTLRTTRINRDQISVAQRLTRESGDSFCSESRRSNS